MRILLHILKLLIPLETNRAIFTNCATKEREQSILVVLVNAMMQILYSSLVESIVLYIVRIDNYFATSVPHM